MTLTKFHLIDAIADQNGFTRKKSTVSIIFGLIDAITGLVAILKD